MASSSSLTSQGHGHEHLKRKIVHKNLSPKERDFRELSRDEQRSSNVNVNANVQLKEPTKDVENNNTEANAKRRKLISMSTSEDEQESEPKNKRILKHKIVNKNLSPKERDFRELSRDEQRSTNVNANVNVQLKEPTKDVENNNTETNTKRRKLFSTSASEDEQESEPKNKRICREKPSMEKLMDKIANAEYPFCEEVSKYDKLAKIGQGTFGEVFKARHRITRKIVALKKVLMENEKEGFPITALREIKILQLLKHENVVNLIEICRTKPSAFNRSKATFYLVFDFCEHDLAGLLSNVNVKFSLGEIKMVMKQLLNGLYFIHSNKILHRDMKAANILITKQGILKLADFGLARAFSVSKNEQPNRYTNRVVTLWYRPPELLLGERNYGPPIDMWGAGCIMAEMWTRSPIMQGVNEQHQLSLISHLCGSITTDSFSGVEKLELFTKLDLSKGEKRRVKERLKAYVKDPYALELLDKLLTIDPTKRIDSDNALNHDFFWLDPLPCDLTKMLLPHTTSMFEYLFSKKKNDQIRHAPGAAAPSRVHPANNDGQYHDRVF